MNEVLGFIVVTLLLFWIGSIAVRFCLAALIAAPAAWGGFVAMWLAHQSLSWPQAFGVGLIAGVAIWVATSVLVALVAQAPSLIARRLGF
jgi:hypothetical protein